MFTWDVFVFVLAQPSRVTVRGIHRPANQFSPSWCSVEYFTHGHYKEEINYDNPLGMQGRMANVYANLVRKV